MLETPAGIYHRLLILTYFNMFPYTPVFNFDVVKEKKKKHNLTLRLILGEQIAKLFFNEIDFDHN